MNLVPLIRAIQRIVHVTDDGRPGPRTWAAIYQQLSGREWQDAAAPVPPSISRLPELAAAVAAPVDDRSERNIATLLPEVRSYARALIHAAAAEGIVAKVISGTRTYQEQDALYAQGRTTPGEVVTNARGGYSNHNFGIAFDIGIFDGGTYLRESRLYSAVCVLGRNLGLECGGDWKTFTDEPHYQLRPAWARGMSERDMLTEFRNRRAHNAPLFPDPLPQNQI